MNDILLTIKQADLELITSELMNIKSELERIKNGQAQKVLTKKEVCKIMQWDESTFERYRRNYDNPLPAYKCGGIKVDYTDFIEWKNSFKQI